MRRRLLCRGLLNQYGSSRPALRPLMQQSQCNYHAQKHAPQTRVREHQRQQRFPVGIRLRSGLKTLHQRIY